MVPPNTGHDSAYDFEFTKEVKDALSIAPSRVGGGESVCSSVSRLRTAQSHAQSSRPWTSVGGGDALSEVASTSMSNLASNRDGKLSMKQILFLILGVRICVPSNLTIW